MMNKLFTHFPIKTNQKFFSASLRLCERMFLFFLFLNLVFINLQRGFCEDREEEWPIFRGDSGLSGEAKAKLPDKLELLWSCSTKGPIKSSPVVHDSIVYVGSTDHFVYALECETGKKVWVFETDAEVEAPPLYADGKVLVGSSGGFFYALDCKTGKLVWKYQAGDRILGSANMIRLEEKSSVVFGSYDSILRCLTIESGQEIWRYTTESYINGTPSVFKDSVIFGGCDAKCHFISENGKKVFSLDLESYIAGSVAITGNIGIVGTYDGQLVALDLLKRKIIWQYGDDETGPFIASPAISKGFAISGSRDKRVHAVSLKSGNGIWIFSTRGAIDSSPVICEDQVIIASKDGWVYILDLNNGLEKGAYEVGAALSGSPAVVSGRIIIGAEDGNVYAYG